MSFERPDIIRPPSEWRSYYLPLTQGCSNNTCAFCSFYGSKLQMRELEEVKREIDALSLYIKSGAVVSGMPGIVYAVAGQWDGRQVFLQDGDALAYPLPKLEEVLEYLNSKFPGLERIASYATPADILRRSRVELERLREQKLGILYMGVESGDDGVLTHIRKGANASEIIEAGRKVKEAGITLSVTVILGLGGARDSERHALATAKILTSLDPDFAGALTLTLVPGTPLYEQAARGEFELISPFQSLGELKLIIENASFSNCFFSSMHASNYLAVRGRLPQERQSMLASLDSVLDKKDPALLRPEFMRGL